MNPVTELIRRRIWVAPPHGVLPGCLTGIGYPVTQPLDRTGAFTAQKPALLVSFIWFSSFGCAITMGVGLLTSGRSVPR